MADRRAWRGDTEEGLAPANGMGLEGVSVDAEGNPLETPEARRSRLLEEMEAARAGTRRGVPNRMARFDITASAKVYGLRALATIVEIMEDMQQPSPVRLAAAKEVLDRGFGRPVQRSEVGGLDGDAEIKNRLVIEFVGVPKRVGEGAQPSAPEPASAVNHKWAQQVNRAVNAQAVEDVIAREVIRSPEDES